MKIRNGTPPESGTGHGQKIITPGQAAKIRTGAGTEKQAAFLRAFYQGQKHGEKLQKIFGQTLMIRLC